MGPPIFPPKIALFWRSITTYSREEVDDVLVGKDLYTLAGAGGRCPGDVSLERDRVSEVLEAHPVFREPGHGEHTRPCPERDDEPLVSDLERSGEGVDDD